MNRQVFFDQVRGPLFGGSLPQSKVDGMNAILDEWDRRKLTLIPWLAYMLATVFWECARTMQPISEYGGKSTRYAPYYGRGFVQLTWKANYEKAGKIVGVDLVANPERALELPIATTILFDGMLDGWFTGKKLADYITPRTTDYVGARRIINGTDKAATIAGYAKQFETALNAAASAPQPIVSDQPVIPTGPAPAAVKPTPPVDQPPSSEVVQAAVPAPSLSTGEKATTVGAVSGLAASAMAVGGVPLWMWIVAGTVAAIVVYFAFIHKKG